MIVMRSPAGELLAVAADWPEVRRIWKRIWHVTKSDDRPALIGSRAFTVEPDEDSGGFRLVPL